MRFGPDGLLYISIGAPCDVCLETKSSKGLTYSSIYTVDVNNNKDQGFKEFATGACGVAAVSWLLLVGVWEC